MKLAPRRRPADVPHLNTALPGEPRHLKILGQKVVQARVDVEAGADGLFDGFPRRRLEAAAVGLWDGAGVYLPQGDCCFAVVMEDCDRPLAVELARRLVHGLREWSQKRDQHMPQVSVSAGLATLGLPPKNFPAHELIEAAQRCLSAAQLSGGDVVKSIDMY